MANGAIDWSRYMEGLQGKTNVDVDNLTDVGKGNIASLGMPSDKWIDISSYIRPLNTYETWQAPVDGYLIWQQDAPPQGAYCHILTSSYKPGNPNLRDYLIGYAQTHETNRNLTVFMTIRKGAQINMVSSGGKMAWCRFVYAEGSQPKA